MTYLWKSLTRGKENRPGWEPCECEPQTYAVFIITGSQSESGRNKWGLVREPSLRPDSIFFLFFLTFSEVEPGILAYALLLLLLHDGVEVLHGAVVGLVEAVLVRDAPAVLTCVTAAAHLVAVAAPSRLSALHTRLVSLAAVTVVLGRAFFVDLA